MKEATNAKTAIEKYLYQDNNPPNISPIQLIIRAEARLSINTRRKDFTRRMREVLRQIGYKPLPARAKLFKLFRSP